MRLTVVLVFLLGLGNSALARDADTPWAGAYERGADIKLTLKKAGSSAYDGTIAIKGMKAPVALKVVGSALEGKFTFRGSAFAMRFVREKGKFVLTSGSKSYELTRLARTDDSPSNPLEDLDSPRDPGARPPPTVPAASAPVDLGVLERLAVRPDPKRTWTILVYLVADNDLENAAVDDLNEMERGLPDSGVEVIVLIDRAKGYDKRAGDWTDTRLYRVRKDNDPVEIGSELLAKLGEANMGDAKVLEAFVHHAFRAFPSQRRMLTLWNHGGGWAAQASDHDDGIEDPNAPQTQGATEDDIKLHELRDGISKGMAGAGVANIDIVGFDMCLMAQLEVATALRGLADVMVASQNLEPEYGWPYDTVLPAFGEGIRSNHGLAKRIISAFDHYYDKAEVGSTTLSALDLEALDPVLRSLDAVSNRLRQEISSAWTTLSRAIYFGESYSDRMDFRKGPGGLHSLDVMDVLKRVQHEVPGLRMQSEFNALVAAMGRFVIDSEANVQRRLSNGVSVYAPVLAETLSAEYAKLDFAKACPGWLALIRSLHAEQAKDTDQVRFGQVALIDEEGHPVESLTPLSGQKISISLDGTNIVWTKLLEGKRVPGGMIVGSVSYLTDSAWLEEYAKRKAESTREADLMLPRYKDGRTTVVNDANGIELCVTNGESTSTPTLTLNNISDTQNVRVRALMAFSGEPDQLYEAHLNFSGRTLHCDEIQLLLPSDGGSLVAREVALEKLAPDTKLVLLHQHVSDQGEISWQKGDTMAWKKGLSLYPRIVEVGAYRLIAIAEKMNGKHTAKTLNFRVTPAPSYLTEGLKNWKRFRPDDLLGKWRMHRETDDGEFAPLQATATVLSRDGLVYRVRLVNEGKTSIQFWRLHARGLPTFHVLGYSESGALELNMLCPAMWVPSADGKHKMLVKPLPLHGVVWGMQRE